MPIENEKRDQGKHPAKKLPVEPMEEGLGDINSSSGEAPENVISNSHSARADKKHGRHNANPITGANPRGI